MRYLVAGAAGHAEEVGWALTEQAPGCELLFFDDRVARGPLRSGLGDVVGSLDAIANYARGADGLVLGIGLPRTKQAVVGRLAHVDLPWTTVVHPRAIVGPGTTLGTGSYVAPGAILTVNVRLGRFATVNLHAVAAHDSVVGEFTTLHPDVHLAGGVSIADGVELGTGVAVIPGRSIGAWAIIGAGAVVVRDIPGGTTYAGVPARPLAAAARGNGGAAVMGSRR